MAEIEVPKPPRSAHNPNRPISSLLRTQVEHMHVAEKQLPSRFRQRIDMYPMALRTEGEAAEYIRRVTEAIRAAHDEAAAKRDQPVAKPKTRFAIAAAAETVIARKSAKSISKTKAKARTKTNAKAGKKTAKKRK